MDQPQTYLSGLDDWVRRRPWFVDALLAAALVLVLAPTSVTLLWGADWPPIARVGVLAAVLVGHLTVAVRRQWPVGCYAVCCLVMLVLVLSPDVSGGSGDLAGQVVPPILAPSALVFPVALYAVGAYSTRPWPIVALGVGLVGAVITTIRLSWTADWMGGTPGVGGVGWRLFLLAGLLAAVVAPWGLGRLRSVRAAYVQALEERAVRAEQRRTERDQQAVMAERARIAREMHDVVAHSLAVIVRQAEGGRFAGDKDPRLAVQALSTVAATGREALTDMRTVLGVLRRDDDGTDDAPQPTVEDVPALVERVSATGTAVTLVTYGEAAALDRPTSLAAYRVVQEALTNVVKHAGPRAAAVVRLDWHDSALDIAVTDDGESRPPLPTDDEQEYGGQGLVGMRERVTSVGGRLTAGPVDAPDARGFSVRAHLPTRGQEVTS